MYLEIAIVKNLIKLLFRFRFSDEQIRVVLDSLQVSDKQTIIELYRDSEDSLLICTLKFLSAIPNNPTLGRETPETVNVALQVDVPIPTIQTASLGVQVDGETK